MTKLIRNQTLSDVTETLQQADNLDLGQNDIIIPLSAYIENHDAVKDRSDVGIWLDSDEAADEIQSLLSEVDLVALNFPSYLDGRAYSTATLIRRDFAFQGELRAIGDVRRDQLEQMMRCGFDAFALAESQDADAALAGLASFSHNYQTSIDRPEPLFRKRS